MSRIELLENEIGNGDSKIEHPESTRSGRSPKGDLRHAEIRATATRLFAESGYHGTSMQNIADTLGLHKANLYYYYKSKEELLFDILSYADREIIALLETQKSETNDPLRLIEKYVSSHVTWYLRNPDIAKVSFRDWSALTGAKLEQQIERRRNYSHILRDHLRECQKLGLIDVSQDVTIVVNFINGAVAATHSWFSPKGALDPVTIGLGFGRMAVAAAISRQTTMDVS